VTLKKWFTNAVSILQQEVDSDPHRAKKKMPRSGVPAIQTGTQNDRWFPNDALAEKEFRLYRRLNRQRSE